MAEVIATTRSIELYIETSGITHCGRDCPGLANGGGHCVFFDRPLVWNPRRTVDGYKRLRVCMDSEITE